MNLLNDFLLNDEDIYQDDTIQWNEDINLTNTVNSIGTKEALERQY